MHTIYTLSKTEIFIVHNSLNFNVLPIIKHLLIKIISRNSCYFGFYPYLCNVIEANRNDNTTYFGDYKGGTVSIVEVNTGNYVYTENI